MGWNFLLLGIAIGLAHTLGMSWYWYLAFIVLWVIDLCFEVIARSYN